MRSGEKKWSDIEREDWQFAESDKECAYCGSKTQLAREHIVPKSFLANERCPECDTIQSTHNQVWSCRKCNSEKGTMGLYSFYKKRLGGEKKYLKTVFCCFERCAKCLKKGDMDGDGQMTVLDIDYALKYYGKLQ